MIGNIKIWSVYANLGLLVIAAAIVSAAFIIALRPLLVRYALARPNARSSQREPTPQGGGIGEFCITLAICGKQLVRLPQWLRQMGYSPSLFLSQNTHGHILEA
jgi:UDP-N-acetylmuramyl pentapeptide phosphotransferase/UDP-N-acetylglucosamine-1-phosphate transferase